MWYLAFWLLSTEVQCENLGKSSIFNSSSFPKISECLEVRFCLHRTFLFDLYDQLHISLIRLYSAAFATNYSFYLIVLKLQIRIVQINTGLWIVFHFATSEKNKLELLSPKTLKPLRGPI